MTAEGLVLIIVTDNRWTYGRQRMGVKQINMPMGQILNAQNDENRFYG
jgi:hypothetical protein